MKRMIPLAILIVLLAIGLAACLPSIEPEGQIPQEESPPAAESPTETVPEEATEEVEASETSLQAELEEEAAEPVISETSPAKDNPLPAKGEDDGTTPGEADKAKLSMVEKVIAQASEISGLPPESFSVVEVTEKEWSDSSLGCPQPDMMYLQVISNGTQVILEADGKLYDFRAGRSGRFRLCENPSD